jgi:hypothetical protein
MKPSLTDTLCTRCGLCCDGSLFADVELASGGEASALEVMGLANTAISTFGDTAARQPSGELILIQESPLMTSPLTCSIFH